MVCVLNGVSVEWYVCSIVCVQYIFSVFMWLELGIAKSQIIIVANKTGYIVYDKWVKCGLWIVAVLSLYSILDYEMQL